MNSNNNILFSTDTYNITHQELINPDAKRAIAYMYNRHGPVRLFGLAGRINRLMSATITHEMIDEVIRYAKLNMVSFPAEDVFRRVVNEFDGKIPLRFEMIPEFQYIPRGTPFLKIQNTEDGFVSLVTYWEGYLTQSFFTSGCFTKAIEVAKITRNIHNFGYRSSNSEYDAMMSGLAMFLVFRGSDNFIMNTIYSKILDDKDPELTPYADLLAAYGYPRSISAASHFVIQSYETEIGAIHRLIQQKGGGGGTVAFPIDTYNHDRFIVNYLPLALEYAKLYNTNVFFRIDSGTNLARQAMSIIEKIMAFCGENEEYRTKNRFPQFGVIIGDNMTILSIKNFTKRFTQYLEKFGRYNSVYKPDEFIHYGWGSGFFNDVTRDRYGFVTKLADVDGRPTRKTSSSGKLSLPGNFYVNFNNNDGNYIVTKNAELSNYVDHTKAVDVYTLNAITLDPYAGERAQLLIGNDVQKDINYLIEKGL